mgnify:CR=1 FL=1
MTKANHDCEALEVLRSLMEYVGVTCDDAGTPNGTVIEGVQVKSTRFRLAVQGANEYLDELLESS